MTEAVAAVIQGLKQDSVKLYNAAVLPTSSFALE